MKIYFISLGNKQVASLLKLVKFCKNPNFVDTRQKDLRIKCLGYWKIPDKTRIIAPYVTIDDLINFAVHKPGIHKIFFFYKSFIENLYLEFMYVQPKNVDTIDELNNLPLDISDWYITPMNSGRTTNYCTFYAGNLFIFKNYYAEKNNYFKL